MAAVPAVVLTALAALAAAVPTILVLAGLALPFVRKWLDEHVAAADVEALKAAVKGAYTIGSAIAPKTPTTLDDSLVTLLKMVSTEFENARGKPPTSAQLTHAAHILTTMHADKDLPNLTVHAPADVGAVMRSITASVAAVGSGATAR